MSTPNTVVAPSSTLSIVPSGDSSPSGDDVPVTLEAIIQEIINDTDDADDLTVKDVLTDKNFEDTLSLAKKTLEDRQRVQQEAIRAREAVAQIERQKAKKEMAARLRATALAKAGFDPLSAEDVQRVNQILTADTAPKQVKPSKVQEPQRSDTFVPSAVIELQKQWCGWPQFVFQLHAEVRMGRAAQGFRSWCVNYASREVDRLLGDKSLSYEILELLSNQKRDLWTFANNSKRVIQAWGLDHTDRNTWANRQEEQWVSQQLKDSYPQIFALSLMPKFESPKEKTEVNAKEEVEKARRNELKNSLKVRLAEVEGGPKENHELQATSLARKHGHLLDIKAIFMARAVFQMTPKDGKQVEERSAKFYAKCADVPFEEILAIVAANAQPEQKLNDSSEQEPDAVASDLPEQSSNGTSPVVGKKAQQEANRKARATKNRSNSRGGRGKGKKKQ